MPHQPDRIHDHIRARGLHPHQPPRSGFATYGQTEIDSQYTRHGLHRIIALSHHQNLRLTLGEVMNWWPSLIPYAQNVESLTVKDPSALSRLTLLQPPKEATTELPFPKLKTLVLCDQRLGHTSCGHQPREQILEYRKLSALLQSRHIETIQIVGGAVSGGVYEHFAKRQLNVVWVNVEYLPNNGPETDDEDED
ncbi:hypothetical protein ONZ45_g1314 [Pleurotus djamor]|nr:hypothetical protein ONZ45_g1314 [Pleurotus djamor]